MAVTQGEVTELLLQMEQDRETFERLARLVYDDTRRLARSRRKEFLVTPTLQTTAVVHEAFAKLFQGTPRVSDRHHLMSLMSRVIRQIIVDYARRQMRQKRGNDPVRSEADVEEIHASVSDAVKVLDLEAALERLEEVDANLADLVCGYYFTGYSAQELAEMRGVSRRTIHRHLLRASTWLRFELNH